MLKELKPAILITIFFTVLTGILYPLAVTGIAQVAFPHQANGSLLTVNGKEVGSSLIGQNFAKPEYFHPRPSAAGDKGYDPTSSGPSNLGPTNPAPANAEAQLARIAEARHSTREQLRQLVAAHIQGRQLGFLGEPRVNVLELNMDLDKNYPVAK